MKQTDEKVWCVAKDSQTMLSTCENGVTMYADNNYN